MELIEPTLYILYTNTIYYVLYIDNKVLIIFIPITYFCIKQMKTR